MAATKSKSSVIERSELNAICVEQRKLFDGYLGHEVISMDVWSDVPMDLINLCYTFFELNVFLLCECQDTEKEGIDVNILHKLAGALYDSYEFYISYLILEILTCFYDATVPKYHNLKAMCLQDWGSSSNESSAEFEIAISLKPHSHIYKWNYGILLIDQEKYVQALEQFIAASDLDPNEPEYVKKIALCYQQLKDYKNAKKNYLQCIELKKNLSKYYLIYARYLNEEINNYIESEKFYNLAIEIEENNRNNINIVGDYYIEYAELLKKLMKYDEISSIYEKCIEIDDNDSAKYYYLYARLFRDDYKNYIKSEIYYKKCLDENPNYDGLNGSYGHLLYLMGKWDESKHYLKIACKLDEKNIWTYFYYGLLMNVATDEISKEEAKKSLQKSLNMFKINCQNNYKNANILQENMKPHLTKTKQVDAKNIDFHVQFENLINEYVQSLRNKN